jgi:hypothetical protein
MADVMTHGWGPLAHAIRTAHPGEGKPPWMGWERIGPTMSAYDEFLEITTGTGRVGYGLVEQGIMRRLA